MAELLFVARLHDAVLAEPAVLPHLECERADLDRRWPIRGRDSTGSSVGRSSDCGGDSRHGKLLSRTNELARRPRRIEYARQSTW
jgi:hypothetical protein